MSTKAGDRWSALHPARLGRGCATAAVAMFIAAAAAADDDYGDAFVRVVSAPDCVDAANFVAEADPAPVNATYMRVQHIGDVGTAELAGQVANVVTWDVGQFTGLSLPPGTFAQTQRGYHNTGPPNPASAFQLACNAAGFYIDSRRFSYTTPVLLGGPNVSIARDLVPPAAIFRNATSALTIEASIRVPYVYSGTPPIIDGTAQVSFMYYARDVTTGALFAHVVQLYDNRVAGVNGTGTEVVSADAFTAFVVSPLSAQTIDGMRTEFAAVAPGSSTMQFVEPWKESRFFRVHISYARFQAMLARLIRDAVPMISPRREDYRVTLFGVLGEIFPGTGAAHEVALGASVTNLTLAETYRPVAPVPVVEFHHAALDRYFISSREDDIEALDSGRIAGWRRTGATFLAWPVFVEGAAPVCRYYLPPPSGSSHFFSASSRECRAVAERHPSFVLEDPAVMYLSLPDAMSGACAAGTVPVYRLWNGRAASNHRYASDAATRQAMVSAGWISEGYGRDGVAMCAPRPVKGAPAGVSGQR